jgi:hypothetical protein
MTVIIPCTIPPCKQWHEIHWTTRVTEATLPDFMAKTGLHADTVYKLPSGGFAVPIPEETKP